MAGEGGINEQNTKDWRGGQVVLCGLKMTEIHHYTSVCARAVYTTETGPQWIEYRGWQWCLNVRPSVELRFLFGWKCWWYSCWDTVNGKSLLSAPFPHQLRTSLKDERHLSKNNLQKHLTLLKKKGRREGGRKDRKVPLSQNSSHSTKPDFSNHQTP